MDDHLFEIAIWTFVGRLNSIIENDEKFLVGFLRISDYFSDGFGFFYWFCGCFRLSSFLLGIDEFQMEPEAIALSLALFQLCL